MTQVGTANDLGPSSAGKAERRSSSPWLDSQPPRRILLIRFHAFGDVAITLPTAASLRQLHPESRIDYLTGGSVQDLLEATELFSKVVALPAKDSPPGRLVSAVKHALRLRGDDYELVIDLQRNWVSRLIRRTVRPKSWSEFDRFSRRSAAVRVRSAFMEAGLRQVVEDFRIPIARARIEQARMMLLHRGWNGDDPLIVLNPAGLWPSRNWPISSYVQFARLWSRRSAAQFLIIGTGRVREKVGILKKELGSKLIDTSGSTSAGQALALLQFASAVITEDSGLMHMSWASGIPTLALFGSSYHVWSAPVGVHCRTLHSGDLPCGACMEPSCRFGDTHCLSRYTAENVVGELQDLLVSLRRGGAS